jgi:hypothetical protein
MKQVFLYIYIYIYIYIYSGITYYQRVNNWFVVWSMIWEVEAPDVSLHLGYVGPNNVSWNVFTAVTMMDVFWELTKFGFSKNRRFEGTYRLHVQGNETFESSQLAARICPTTDSEESLLQRYLHRRVFLLPWSYCWWAVASPNTYMHICIWVPSGAV